MSDLVRRLRAEVTENRRYEVTGTLALEAADRIEQLEAALAMFVCDCTVSERCPVPDNCRNFQARRTMEAKCSFS